MIIDNRIEFIFYCPRKTPTQFGGGFIALYGTGRIAFRLNFVAKALLAQVPNLSLDQLVAVFHLAGSYVDDLLNSLAAALLH